MLGIKKDGFQRVIDEIDRQINFYTRHKLNTYPVPLMLGIKEAVGDEPLKGYIPVKTVLNYWIWSNLRTNTTDFGTACCFHCRNLLNCQSEGDLDDVLIFESLDVFVIKVREILLSK